MKPARSGYSVPTHPNHSLRQIITPPSQSYQFGNNGVRVSGDSNYLVVSCRSGSSSNNYGTVFIYVWNTVTEQFDYQTQLFAPTPSANDNYGLNLAIDDTGTRLVVTDEPAGVGGNSVYIYTRSGATWSLEDTITDADYPAGSYITLPTYRNLLLDGTGSTLGLTINDGSNNITISIVDRSGTSWTIGQSISISGTFAQSFSFSNNGDYMVVAGRVYFRSVGVYSLQSTVGAGEINGNGDNILWIEIVSSGGSSPRENNKPIIRNSQRSGATWTTNSTNIEHPEWHGFGFLGWSNEISYGSVCLQTTDSTEVIVPAMNVAPYPPQSGSSGGFFYENYAISGFGLLTRSSSSGTLNYNNFTPKPDYERPTPLLGNNTLPGANATYNFGDMSDDAFVIAITNYEDTIHSPAGSTGCVYIYTK